MSRSEVVVIGGGLAGVAAALDLAEAGAQVTLLERRAKLGGLTWSFRRNGRWFDNGQHVFLRCCSAYRSFLERIGASGMVTLQERLSVPVLAPGGRRATISRSALPAPLHLAGSLARYRHLKVADRLRLVRAALGLRRLDPDDPALDRVAFGAWLHDHGQRPVAVERLWNLIALPTINVDAEEASLALATMVFKTGLLDAADAGDIGWSKVPLGELHGERAGAALARAGVEVHLAATVEAIDSDGPRQVVSAGGCRVEADAVVVATPPPVAEALIGAGRVGPVTELGASPIVNVHLVFDRKVTDLAMFACVDSPVQFVFDRTDSAHFGTTGSGQEQCLSISLSGAESEIGRRPEDLIASHRAALAEVLPRARSAELLDAVVTRERAATFRGVPGTAPLRPGPVTPIDGIYVAGAWCATGWPATMEGAVRSGCAAAAAALGRLSSTSSADFEAVAS